MTHDPMFPRVLRAATLTQPWAGLVAAGIKPIENRRQPIAGPELFGQRIAIHASREIDPDVYARIFELAPELLTATFTQDPGELSNAAPWYKLSRVTSAIIGVATLKHHLKGWNEACLSGSHPRSA